MDFSGKAEAFWDYWDSSAFCRVWSVPSSEPQRPLISIRIEVGTESERERVERAKPVWNELAPSQHPSRPAIPSQHQSLLLSPPIITSGISGSGKTRNSFDPSSLSLQSTRCQSPAYPVAHQRFILKFLTPSYDNDGKSWNESSKIGVTIQMIC